MNYFVDELLELKKQNLYRQLHEYLPHKADKVIADGREYLMLASNNYLGLTHHENVKQAAMEAIRKYGTGSGGSRLTTGTHPLFEELETAIAKFKGKEKALIFNTGYMANVGVISALAKADDVIFSDELNHASIIDGIRLSKCKKVIYKHADLNELENRLKNTSCKGRKIIITDGVFSMDGDIAPLKGLVELKKKYEALIIVDDAHATGVIGPQGKGTAAYYGVSDEVDIQIGTLSKAVAAEGGFVATSNEIVDYLINKARSFIFSTAISPATTAAALMALKILSINDILVTKLQYNAEIVREVFKTEKINFIDGQTPIIPILIGEAKASLIISEKLKEEGIILSSIRPPTVPQGQSRLRLTVMAVHEEKELRSAAQIIAHYVKAFA